MTTTTDTEAFLYYVTHLPTDKFTAPRDELMLQKIAEGNIYALAIHILSRYQGQPECPPNAFLMARALIAQGKT